MNLSRVSLLIAACIFPVSCISDSLLTPTAFPKTYADVDFVDRLAVAQESYEPFMGLTPYEALEIIEADQAVVEEMEQEEQNANSINPPTPSAEQPTTSPSVPNTPPQPITITPVAPGNSSDYNCAIYNGEIPAGQRIPLGKPVFSSVYRMCSKYGWRKISGKSDFHHGIDIGCTLKHYDQPVFAPADGVVERVVPNSTGQSAGNYIVIKHDNGFTTKYMHLNQMLVKKGDIVRAGCQIATIGNTGGAKANKNSFKNNPYPTMSKNGSHLHYEIHYTGKSPISIHSKVINVQWGRVTDSGTVKDYSINPEPFVLF